MTAKGGAMRARVGDRLAPDGDLHRVGVIISLRNADESPPYVVKWLSDGHIALFLPGPYTRVMRGGPSGDATERAERPPDGEQPRHGDLVAGQQTEYPEAAAPGSC
jgi:Domain of unknown function (DUF1918)